MPNAIILAAGLSSRFAPLSYEWPKALLRVKGEVLIERQIRQLQAAGVSEIHIITGYFAEQFSYLAGKFGVNLIYNPLYKSHNNIASLHCAAEFLRDTFVLSSDNYLATNVFAKSPQDAWYMGKFHDGERLDEWFMSEDERGYISGVKIGANRGYYMMGPVYFSAEFSREFLPILRAAHKDVAHSNLLWESLLASNLERLKMRINKVAEGVVYEFDSLEDLRQFDARYIDESGCRYLQNIAAVFGAREGEIAACKPLDAGMSNRSFKFRLRGEEYIYRVACCENFLADRRAEAAAVQAVSALNISDECVHFDARTGDKISKFIPDASAMQPHNNDHMLALLALLKRLHRSGICVEHEFDFEGKITRLLSALGAANSADTARAADAAAESGNNSNAARAAVAAESGNSTSAGKIAPNSTTNSDAVKRLPVTNFSSSIAQSAASTINAAESANIAAVAAESGNSADTARATISTESGNNPYAPNPHAAALWPQIRSLLAHPALRDAPRCFCHMDAVADNVLCAHERFYLIDYEYAAMCDARAEIAQIVLYSGLSEAALFDIYSQYLGAPASEEDRFCLLAYAAASAFLWYLWALYYGQNGHDYSRYAAEQLGFCEQFLASALVRAGALAGADGAAGGASAQTAAERTNAADAQTATKASK